jgi:hypothetical protein
MYLAFARDRRVYFPQPPKRPSQLTQQQLEQLKLSALNRLGRLMTLERLIVRIELDQLDGRDRTQTSRVSVGVQTNDIISAIGLCCQLLVTP